MSVAPPTGRLLNWRTNPMATVGFLAGKSNEIITDTLKLKHTTKKETFRLGAAVLN